MSSTNESLCIGSKLSAIRFSLFFQSLLGFDRRLNHNRFERKYDGSNIARQGKSGWIRPARLSMEKIGMTGMPVSPHVVMLNKAYPPWRGGIERHVRDVAEALVIRGWRVSVLVCHKSRRMCRETINGVQVIRIPQYLRIFSQPIVTGYFRYLREIKPDLVHVHVPFPLGWFAIHSVEKNVPILCTWHSDIIRQRKFLPLLSPFQKRFLQRCKRILPTSLPLLENSYDLQPYRDHCTVISLATPPLTETDERVIQDRLEMIEQNFPNQIVLFVGRLVGYKGLPYLIEAMQRVDATLLIAGDGPDRSALQKWTRRLGVQSKVFFLGEVNEIDKIVLYRLADVFVLPSITRNEAFGYVLLEAMEQGCPVISTDLPTGVRFVNRHEISGLIVPPNDELALQKALQRIIMNPSFRQSLSEGARKRIREEFRLDKMIDRIEHVHRDALSESKIREEGPAS